MTRDDFMAMAKRRMDFCLIILDAKREEYGPNEDRLEQFWKAGKLLNVDSPIKALAGMMVKHTTSIYEMLSSPSYQLREKWEEKITDQINYLLLLEGLLTDIYWEDTSDH